MELEQDLYKAEAENYRRDAVCATLAPNQTFEQIADDQHVPMNPTVKRAANLEKHIVNSTASSADPTPMFFNAAQKPHSNHKPHDMIRHHPPSIDLTISDDEVQRRMGFPSLSSLLIHMFIVCDSVVVLL